MIPEITFALGVARIFYAIHLTNTAVGIALAHVILAAPFAVVVLVSTFEGMDPRLLEAGAVLGCGPLRLFRRVTLPLALPGIVAAALFSFLASYNDFVLTLMVYGPTRSHCRCRPICRSATAICRSQARSARCCWSRRFRSCWAAADGAAGDLLGGLKGA